MPTDNEAYCLGEYRFDITTAIKLISAGILPHYDTEINALEYAKALKMSVNRTKPLTNDDQGHFVLMRINWGHAASLDEARLNTPGLLVETPMGHLLVDGAHRMVRRIYHGLDTMPVHVVTKKHINMIRFGYAPYLAAKKKLEKILIPA